VQITSASGLSENQVASVNLYYSIIGE